MTVPVAALTQQRILRAALHHSPEWLSTHVVDALTTGLAEAPAPAAVAHRDHLADERDRGLLGGDAADVEPDRLGDARDVLVGEALGEQALDALVVRPPRAHGADVGGVAAQRQAERRIVELRVVR